MMYTLILLLTAAQWRKVLNRYSWIKTFGICNLFWFPSEFLFFFLTKDATWMFMPLSMWQNILNVGLNLSYANVLYMNLPEENSNTHIAFYSIGANLFAFLGLMTGTIISGMTGDTPLTLLGMEVYAVQFTVILKGTMHLLVGVFLFRYWRKFTREDDIQAVEAQDAVSQRTRQMRREQRKQRKIAAGR
jgi:hypothetical protein